MRESVAVLGSIHMDLLVGAPRLPTLGETLMGENWYQTPGGKGLNQAVSCARAGVHVAMYGAVGHDGFGDTLLDYMKSQHVSTHHVTRVRDARSGISIVVRTPDDYGAVVSSQVNAALSRGSVAHWAQRLAHTDMLVLQNEIPEEVNVAAALLVRRAGGQVVLNAAPARTLSRELSDQLTLLVVNAVEASMMGTGEVHDLDAAARACAQLQAMLGCAVVVTAGPHGAAWMLGSGECGNVAGIKVDVITSHGAGDAFIGHLVAELSRERCLGDAVEVANRQAALFVSTPRPQEHRELA
ncbi:ribokinase [Robbsia sp. Bb-Pol-6]|uniref:Ribokinase n=1 Tax=Robbsia betulipollinis TaxID=2981849 RepID=A0ABT3ZIT3_9BURK|nr:ribokinase [Robbsia betulipollinis]MCY0385865.1 ribokinase [Robbsia betulipollinis]